MVLVPLVSHLPHSQTLVTRLVSNIQRETVLYSTHNNPIGQELYTTISHICQINPNQSD